MARAAAKKTSRRQPKARRRTPAGEGRAVGSLDPEFLLARRLNTKRDEFRSPYRQSSWVFAGVKACADNIASTPLLFHRGFDDEEGIDPTREPSPGLEVFRRPNPQLIELPLLLTATAKFWWLCGAAVWVKESVAARWSPGTPPASIWALPGTRFRPVIDRTDGETILGWELRTQRGSTLYKPHELIWFRDFNPDSPLEVFGRVNAAELPAESDHAAAQFNKAFFEEGADPGGVLTSQSPTPLNKEQQMMIREQFEDRHRGARKAHRVAVLGGGMTWTPNPRSQRDMEFSQLRSMSRDEILAVLGVPKILVGIVEDYNRATAESAKATFFENTLIPVMKRWEAAITADLLTWGSQVAGLVARFDTTMVEALKENLPEKVTAATQLWNMGYPANAINERLRLGLPKLDIGDTSFLPFSVQPASSATVEDALDPEPEAEPAPGNPPDDEDDDPDDEADGESERTMRGAPNWQRFVRAVNDPLERRARSSLKRHFYEMRRDVLREFGELTREGPSKLTAEDVEILFRNREEWDKRLRGMMEGLYDAARDKAAERTAVELGAFQSWSTGDPRTVQFFADKLVKVTRVNRTVLQNLRTTILDGIANAETTSELAGRIRTQFKFTASRSVMIARTEVAQSVEGTRFNIYKAEGVEKHRWITAGDHAVRHSHQVQNGSVRRVGEHFPNGLLHPADPAGPPQEVINCRCDVVAVRSKD